MMLRLTQLHVAAVALAIAAVSMSAPVALAFTQENLSTSGNGSQFADPDDQVKNFGQGHGVAPFGQNGPVVQFGVQQGPGAGSLYSPFNRFQGGMNDGPPPDPYARPLGNGD
jgi:hypothetical protein